MFGMQLKWKRNYRKLDLHFWPEKRVLCIHLRQSLSDYLSSVRRQVDLKLKHMVFQQKVWTNKKLEIPVDRDFVHKYLQISGEDVCRVLWQDKEFRIFLDSLWFLLYNRFFQNLLSREE